MPLLTTVKPNLILPTRPKLIIPFDDEYYDEVRNAITSKMKRSNSRRRAAASGNPTLLAALTTLGLTTNLKLCLDAGDSLSYSSGQSWLDRSGGGYDFFRGANNTATTDDPTFNGVAGGLSSSEYWSFDGGDIFTYDSANETWMQNLHKDNAIFSWMAYVYIGVLGSSQSVWGTSGALGGGSIGAYAYSSSANVYKFRAASGSLALDLSHSVAVTTGWHFFAGAINEATGANGARLVLDGTAEQFTSTYTTPSASSAAQTMALGSAGSTTAPLTSGSRMAELAMWEGTALTSTNLTDIFTATKTRFGL